NPYVGPEMVGHTRYKTVELPLPEILAVVPPKLVAELGPEPVLILCIALPVTLLHLAGHRGNGDRDRVDAWPMAAHEVQVDNIVEHAVVVLEHQVELAMRIGLE